jgi:signal transduction histidine kinase
MVACSRRRLGGVRVRTTAFATLVVAAALAFGGVLLVFSQRQSLDRNLTTTTRLRAQDVSALLTNARVPTQLTVPSDERSLVQVVDASTGRVIAASSNIEGEPRILGEVPAVGRFTSRTVRGLPLGESSFRVVAHTVALPTGKFVVYAAASLAPVDESTQTLVRLLVIGLPMLLVLVAGTVWLVTGWALSPVERVRSEVAEIGDGDLHRRVPEPGTGDEIDRLSRTMNAMLARVEGAAARQRRFVADASHELRSPLTAIRAQLEVDLAHPQRAKWQTTEQDVLDETARMQRMVEDLLVLAQSDAGTLRLRRERVDLDDLVLEEARPVQARDRVVVDLAGVSGGQVIGDPDQLRRAFRNLLDNAERHAASVVRVQLHETDSTVELTVTDDGPGIPPDQRAAVFERFARLDGARTRDVGGTGLGLAIAREIIVAHRGALAITDTDAGATFLVTLPAAADSRSRIASEAPAG